MSKKSELKKYMAGLIKGREKALAAGMGITVEALTLLVAGGGENVIQIDDAVTLGRLTDTDPRIILNLQMEVDLEELGVPAAKSVAAKVKTAKPKKDLNRSKGAAVAPARKASERAYSR